MKTISLKASEEKFLKFLELTDAARSLFLMLIESMPIEKGMDTITVYFGDEEWDRFVSKHSVTTAYVYACWKALEKSGFAKRIGERVVINLKDFSYLKVGT